MHYMGLKLLCNRAKKTIYKGKSHGIVSAFMSMYNIFYIHYRMYVDFDSISKLAVCKLNSATLHDHCI